MIALHEHEEALVRRESEQDPLARFLRRKPWLADRRPRLARAGTAPELSRG